MSPAGEISAFIQVILVDLVLAGDNAIVIAMVVGGFPARRRIQLLILGIAAATLVRISFAVGIVHLMDVVGLVLAGGLVLLWVGWKLWREIEDTRQLERSQAGIHRRSDRPPKTVVQAVTQIVIADISMSLDNVLAVAGIAREHTWVLVAGLLLSIAFMGCCATLLARLLQRYRWVAYLGLLTILYVAGTMIWDGSVNTLQAVR